LPNSEASPPLRVVRIQVLQGAEGGVGAFLDELVRVGTQRYGDVSKENGVIEVSRGGALCWFSVEEVLDFPVLTSTIHYDGDYELGTVLDDDLRFFDLSDPASSPSISNPLSTFTIFMPQAEAGEPRTALVDRYSKHLSRSKKGVGIVGGHLLSIFESRAGEEELFNRYYFLQPLRPAGGAAEGGAEEILSDIKRIAAHTAELSRLYRRCRNFFSVLGSGEMEISEKVEEFLWRLLGPKAVELETLESWLGYIMERDSTTSAMIATMQVNHMEARSIVSKVENAFAKLRERALGDHPTNSEMEMAEYRGIIGPFESYIVRSRSLKERLETVLDEVRTYLSIQQQRATMEEQRASKEQLVRLVNLQEIFHKVEIFIVAVYITEMARIVFEVLFHEEALLLTAGFIPVALLLAIGVGRLLHRG